MKINICNHDCTELWDRVLYKRLSNYPNITDWEMKNAIHDGFLPIKVKDEVVLADYVDAIIIPEEYQKIVQETIPNELADRTYYIKNDCKDVWDWSEKVYSFIERMKTMP